ncbi:MAG: VWA domain-containing protein [Staphylothermus sp.]|nr:VWA domain-containing protein [Staphylothermus sp.]
MDYIKMDFYPARELVLSNVTDTVPFVITIRGTSTTAPPSALFLLIDTSPSMDGEKIFYAKQAALSILELLRDKDYVAIYSFTKKFIEEQPPTILANNRIKVEKSIASLKLGSGTNIYNAIKKIKEKIEAYMKSANIRNINLVIITDGRPTIGPKNTNTIIKAVRLLKQFSLNVAIIGVGEDYNEKLLLKMATALNGIYEHVTPMKSLKEILAKYIVVTKDISARNLKLTIKTYDNTEIRIYNKEYTVLGNYVEIELGNIYYGEKHDIVGEIIVNATGNKVVKIADIILSYINPETNEHEFTEAFPVKFKAAPKEEVVRTSLNENVLAKTRTMKIISKMKESIESEKVEQLKKMLEELLEATIKLGDLGLISKTMSVREKLEKEGLSPDVSREITSLISKIIVGKNIYYSEKGEKL